MDRQAFHPLGLGIGGISVNVFFAATTILGLYRPAKFAEVYGLPGPGPGSGAPSSTEGTRAPPGADDAKTPSTEESEPSPWIRVVAGRNLTLTLLSFALMWRRDWRTMGILYACCAPAAALDGWTVWTYGIREKHMMHTPNAVILPILGWITASFY